MTIYEIKRLTEKTEPYFFSRNTMKFFKQTLKDFRVYKLNKFEYLITAKSFAGNLTQRIFDIRTNELRLLNDNDKGM